jgi:hypothetical protein
MHILFLKKTKKKIYTFNIKYWIELNIFQIIQQYFLKSGTLLQVLKIYRLDFFFIFLLLFVFDIQGYIRF